LSFELGDEATVELVASLLGPSPVSLDELARAAELDVMKVRAAVIELELAGRIERSGGDRVALLAPDEST
jgi:DNA processing protein